MAEPHVISALRAKRAELDGDLRQARKRIANLQTDMEAIDRALRVFDPTIIPHVIRPLLKRKPTTQFRHGYFSRAVIDVLRRVGQPMTVREIANRIAADYRVDVPTATKLNRLVAKVRNALARDRAGIVRETRGEAIVWRAG